MNANEPISFALRFTPLAALAGTLIVLATAGLPSGEGLAIGAALSISSLWFGRFVVKHSIHRRTNKVIAISKLEVLFLLKLPIFAGVGYYVTSLGLRPTVYFLVGYLLVYLGLIVGAIHRRSAPASTDEVS